MLLLISAGKGYFQMKQAWEKFEIINHDGLRLSALLCKAAVHKSVSQQQRSPLVVVCHGFTGSKEGGGRALEMGEALAARGFCCLLFDFAGCGESEGRWEEISLSGHVRDLAAVVQWCRESGFNTIILNGRSFGGAAALCYASSDRTVAGVCTWAVPARPVELFSKFAGGKVQGPAGELVKLAAEEGTLCLRKSFFYDLERHDLRHCAARLAPRPLLVLHGTADEVVLPEEAYLIAAAAAEPKELLMVEGADHRFSAHLEVVWRSFFHWLDRYFALQQ